MQTAPIWLLDCRTSRVPSAVLKENVNACHVFQHSAALAKGSRNPVPRYLFGFSLCVSTRKSSKKNNKTTKETPKNPFSRVERCTYHLEHICPAAKMYMVWSLSGLCWQAYGAATCPSSSCPPSRDRLSGCRCDPNLDRPGHPVRRGLGRLGRRAPPYGHMMEAVVVEEAAAGLVPFG